MTIIVMGHARLAPGNIEKLQDAMRAQLEATNAEDGCEHYSFARHVLEPDTLIISERWRDAEALAAHGKAPHMAAFNKAMGGAGIQEISVKAYENGEVRTLIGA